MEYHNTIAEMKEILDAIDQEKDIQCFKIDEWMDTLNTLPNFGLFKYRIKPESKETMLTNRELSKWLAEGKGEVLGSNKFADTAWNYPTECSNVEVREGCEIRKWDDTEWRKPTREYAFGEED